MSHQQLTEIFGENVKLERVNDTHSRIWLFGDKYFTYVVNEGKYAGYMKCTTLIQQVKGPQSAMYHYKTTHQGKIFFAMLQNRGIETMIPKVEEFFNLQNGQILEKQQSVRAQKKELQGDYYHPDVVLAVCQWLSMELFYEMIQIVKRYQADYYKKELYKSQLRCESFELLMQKLNVDNNSLKSTMDKLEREITENRAVQNRMEQNLNEYREENKTFRADLRTTNTKLETKMDQSIAIQKELMTKLFGIQGSVDKIANKVVLQPIHSLIVAKVGNLVKFSAVQDVDIQKKIKQFGKVERYRIYKMANPQQFLKQQLYEQLEQIDKKSKTALIEYEDVIDNIDGLIMNYKIEVLKIMDNNEIKNTNVAILQQRLFSKIKNNYYIKTIIAISDNIDEIKDLVKHDGIVNAEAYVNIKADPVILKQLCKFKDIEMSYLGDRMLYCIGDYMKEIVDIVDKNYLED